MEKQVELKLGVNGKGNRVYCVFVITNGVTEFIHRFDTEEEAKNWIKWAY